jgi:DNA mismatch repair protein MutL
VEVFVGRRPVRDRNILHAITMGYGELVARGRYPVAVVLVDVPMGQVDINVHPQKLEVRFAEPATVAAAVRHVVQAGVASGAWRVETAGPIQMIASLAPPALPFDGGPTPLAQRYARDLDRARREGSQPGFAFAETMPASANRAPRIVRAPSPARAWVSEVQQQTRAARAAERRLELRETTERPSPIAKQPFASFPEEPDSLAEGSGPAANAPAAAPGYFAKLRYLGQLDLTYLVCESEGELVLVDQHSAHERVELDRLRTQRIDHAVPVQKLLFPTTLDATARQLELVDRMGDLLATVGFECEAFGVATLAIKAVPAGIRHGDPSQLLRRLLDGWARDGTPSEDEQIDRVLAEIACHSVMRSGDRLTPDEAEALLRSVDGIDVTAPAPHGRALLLRLPLAEIGRRFGR